LFLQVQQLETAKLSLKLFLRLWNIPQGKSVHITNIQNELFIEMTTFNHQFIKFMET